MKNFPGVWHEPCLEDPDIERLALPPASFVYEIRAETRKEQPVVVVTDKNGVEHLVARHPCHDLQAEQTRRVAEVLSVFHFEDRYSFMGDREKYLHHRPA